MPREDAILVEAKNNTRTTVFAHRHHRELTIYARDWFADETGLDVKLSVETPSFEFDGHTGKSIKIPPQVSDEHGNNIIHTSLDNQGSAITVTLPTVGSSEVPSNWSPFLFVD